MIGGIVSALVVAGIAALITPEPPPKRYGPHGDLGDAVERMMRRALEEPEKEDEKRKEDKPD